MSRFVKKWVCRLRSCIESRMRKPRREYDEEYDETKEEFERVMGRPKITITVELPKRFERYKSEFLILEGDQQFLKEVKNLVKERLRQTRKKKRRRRII